MPIILGPPFGRGREGQAKASGVGRIGAEDAEAAIGKLDEAEAASGMREAMVPRADTGGRVLRRSRAGAQLCFR